ncbi:MAG: NAD(P)-dependent oxidoreductase [Pirellulaceae bacterium]|nr:NAD(P)-dependent oxidoreductase [Pirellulaceae bacterium]
MKAWITGITGFAGSFLAEKLLQSGYQVAGSSRSGKWHHLVKNRLLQKTPLWSWDLRHPPSKELKEFFLRYEPNTIFHLGALSQPAQCGQAKPSTEASEVNVHGTNRICELATLLPNCPTLLFTSSSQVYRKKWRRSQEAYVDETAETFGHNGYSQTKLAAETIVLDFAKNGGKGIVVRPFHHAGPRLQPTLMLSEWSRQLACHQKTLTVRCRNSYLDLTDVRDVVVAYQQLAESGKSGEIYNVGSGIIQRSGDLFDQLQELAQSQAPVTTLQEGPQFEAIASTKKLCQILSWKPRIPLSQTLADTLSYWQQIEKTR